MKRTKLEIPFGHAFDSHGVSSSKSAVRLGGPSVFDQPSRSAPYRTAYATAIITFANHEANAPILTPVIPAMIAAATMALIATQTPQRRSALR